MRRMIALATTLSLTGCSFFLTQSPSSADRFVDPGCTDSMAWPIVDGSLAGLFALSAIAAAADDDMTVGDEDDPTPALVVMAAVATAGAIVGYSRVSKCKVATRRYRETYPYGTQPYPYGGYPGYPQQGYPPAQPYPSQPYPSQPAPRSAPGAQPAPAPTPPAQPIPPWAPPDTKPAPAPPPSALGTEGEVCTTDAECSSGFSCTGNVCLKAKPKATPSPKRP